MSGTYSGEAGLQVGSGQMAYQALCLRLLQCSNGSWAPSVAGVQSGGAAAGLALNHAQCSGLAGYF